MAFQLAGATDPQKLFWADTAKYRAFVAGIGAGKTFAGAVEILRQEPGSTGMVLAPSFPMLRRASLKTFEDLVRPTGLIKSFNRAEMRMELAGGRTVFWASADNPDSLRGPSLGWIWLDEAALMTSETWLIALGRLRKAPGRMWATTTPRGTRHWLYELVRDGRVSVTNASSASNVFNPADYVESISVGSADWQRQEVLGEFVEPGGQLLKRHWFKYVDKVPDLPRLSVRSWDTAATSGAGDWSVGTLVHKIDGHYYIADVIRGQWGAEDLDQIQRSTAIDDGYETTVVLEREPGSAGIRANQYVKSQLQGYHVVEERVTQRKLLRAMPMARLASAGNITIVKGGWNREWLDEVTNFTGSDEDGEIDDQVDSAANAINWMARKQDIVLA